MNIVQLVFSPTGGTKRAADLLSKYLGETVRVIDLTDAALAMKKVCSVRKGNELYL